MTLRLEDWIEWSYEDHMRENARALSVVEPRPAKREPRRDEWREFLATVAEPIGWRETIRPPASDDDLGLAPILPVEQIQVGQL